MEIPPLQGNLMFCADLGKVRWKLVRSQTSPGTFGHGACSALGTCFLRLSRAGLQVHGWNLRDQIGYLWSRLQTERK
jgi:hypothetical protein